MMSRWLSNGRMLCSICLAQRLVRSTLLSIKVETVSIVVENRSLNDARIPGKHLKLGKNHELVYYDAVSKHVQDAHSCAPELGISDYTIAHLVDETEMAVYHIHAPVADGCSVILGYIGPYAPTERERESESSPLHAIIYKTLMQQAVSILPDISHHAAYNAHCIWDAYHAAALVPGK
jgi:hypothetical protein